jgi:hypothetical protein
MEFLDRLVEREHLIELDLDDAHFGGLVGFGGGLIEPGFAIEGLTSGGGLFPPTLVMMFLRLA